MNISPFIFRFLAYVISFSSKYDFNEIKLCMHCTFFEYTRIYFFVKKKKKSKNEKKIKNPGFGFVLMHIQRCRCFSFGCTTCADRPKRHAKSGIVVAVNQRPQGARLGGTSPSQRLVRCRAVTGFTEVQANCSKGHPCSRAIRSMKSPCRYQGNFFIFFFFI